MSEEKLNSSESEVKYTEAQKRAVSLRGRSILVSAGAGSGKTAVMTARITELIKEKAVQANELLVVTFTRAAASQMKRKIRESLMKEAKKANDAYLYKQLTLLELSQISTVHTLCSSVIKEYYQVAGIDPSFSMIADAEEAVLLRESVDEAFETMYEESDDGFSDLVDDFSSGISDDALRQSVDELYRFTRNRIDGMAWLKNAEESFGAENEDDFANSRLMDIFISYSLKKVEASEECFRRALKLSRGTDAPPAVADVLAEYLEYSELLKKHLLEKNVGEYLRQLKQVTFKRFDIRKPYENKELIKICQDEGKSIIKDELKKKFFFGIEEYFSQIKDLEPQMKALSKLVRLTDEIYTAKKRENTNMDFSDLEHLCLKVLNNKEVGEKLKKRFKYVFVDEYQDTNDIQEAIINLISSDDNLFVVGDVKQSIYSFRNAEPALFTNRRLLYENNPERGEVITLADNFRSDKNIINAVNELFGKIMFKESGGVDYSANGEAMKAATEYLNPALPQLHVLFSDNDETSMSEAEYVAALIKKIIAEDEIFDKDLGCLRKVRLSDIAVLMRSVAGYAENYVKAFEDAGISVNSPENTGFYDLTEIALALDVMRITDNFRNDIALVGAMRSFIYNFSEDDLLAIRAAFSECAYFHECVILYAETGENEELRTSLKYFTKQIDEFVSLSRTAPLEELLGKMYSQTGLYDFVGALPNGSARQSNLRYLKSLAASYEASSAGGLGGFIRFAEKAKSGSKFKKNHISQDPDSVTLMSVHKSKGLEFNVVIVANCGNRYSVNSMKSNILFEKKLGICPTYRSAKKNYKAASLPKALAGCIISENESAEEMRILYVAATRAIQRLHFVGSMGKKTYDSLPNEPSEYFSQSSSSFIKLLAAAYKNSEAVVIVTDARGEIENSSGFRAETQLEKAALKENASTENSKIADRLGYSYGSLGGKVPSKISVSAVKESETLALGEKVISLSEGPSFISREEKVTPAMKGTIIHYLLQNIDLKAARENLHIALEDVIRKSEEKEMFASGVISKADRALITGFFSSELGLKLLSADKVEREYEFIMRLKASEVDEVWKKSNEQILVQGVIDCLFENDGKRYIIDYKTDRAVFEDGLKTLNEIYSKQVKMYALACEKMEKPANEAYICYLRANKSIKVEI